MEKLELWFVLNVTTLSIREVQRDKRRLKWLIKC